MSMKGKQSLSEWVNQKGFVFTFHSDRPDESFDSTVKAGQLMDLYSEDIEHVIWHGTKYTVAELLDEPKPRRPYLNVIG